MNCELRYCEDPGTACSIKEEIRKFVLIVLIDLKPVREDPHNLLAYLACRPSEYMQSPLGVVPFIIELIK